MSRILLLMSGLVLFLLIGCSPEELEITISPKEVQSAKYGSIGHAEVSVSFENGQESVKEKLGAIRNAVLPYLGKGGKMTVRGDKVNWVAD